MLEVVFHRARAKPCEFVVAVMLEQSNTASISGHGDCKLQQIFFIDQPKNLEST